ncbi:MAG TPA: FAD-dependent oxidoreductase, partial [Alphaproteobacteria bacterium]|nr:FAD-dependent oxidoreductase [Alphaproteobacteria bacterium]
GPAMGLENFWMCCGSSIGIAQGAGCGKYLAQWMIHGDAEINMAGLDPRRFCGMNDDAWVRAKSFEDYTHMYQLHLPGEERPAGRDLRKTSLYETLKNKGAVFTEAASWERPKWFSLDGRAEEPGFGRTNVHEVVAEECRAVRMRVGVTDLSSFAKFDVTGADAEAYLNRITANRVPGKNGGIALTHLLGDNGMIQSEATVTRLAEDHFYVLSGAIAQHRDLDHLRHPIHSDEDVQVADITDDWGVLVVAGPRARDSLAKITAAELTNENFRWLSGQFIEVADIELRALRVNYVGELGWELHVPMPDMPALYEAVWAAGEEYGIADVGTYAVNSLRLEKAYKGWGAELTNEITMIEADMERFVKYDKNDFIGKAATLKRKQEGISMRLVYCELEARNHDAHGGEAVLRDGEVIGVTTSGGWGNCTEKSLAFAYVAPEFADPGAQFDVEILSDAIKATVLEAPVYDPHNARPRA